MKNISKLEQLILIDQLNSSSFLKNSIIPKHKYNLKSFAEPNNSEDQKTISQLNQLNKVDWNTVDKIDKGYKIFIDILSVLSWLPLPMGNPFSLALAGDAFAKKDYLGAIMALGVKRTKIGDLILKNNQCYLATLVKFIFI